MQSIDNDHRHPLAAAEEGAAVEAEAEAQRYPRVNSQQNITSLHSLTHPPNRDIRENDQIIPREIRFSCEKENQPSNHPNRTNRTGPDNQGEL